MAAAKGGGNALEDVALVAGTQQNLSNPYSEDIYEAMKKTKFSGCIHDDFFLHNLLIDQ